VLPSIKPEAANEAILLGDSLTPLRSISKALEHRYQQGQPVGELHLIAHGNSGGLSFGGQWINSAALLRHAEELENWRIRTLVLWCCQIGQNNTFIALLEELTGAEVFASPLSIHKGQLNVYSRQGKLRQLSEIIPRHKLQLWEGNLEWIQVADDIEGRKGNARSGETVSLSNDGKILAIGSWNDGFISKQQGSVAVYQEVNNDWQRLGNIINGTDGFDRFGSEVRLSNDGTRLAVGAPRGDRAGEPGDDNAGEASVYELTGGNWSQLGGVIEGVGKNSRAGGGLAFSGDGTTVAIGAIRYNGNRGYVGIYRYNGAQWDRVGNYIRGDQKKEYSGWSVDISEN